MLASAELHRMAKTAIPYKKADDLFEKSSMSFGAHLEELRKSLMIALVCVAAGMAIGLFFARWLVNYVQTPLRAALVEYYLKQSQSLFDVRGVGNLSPEMQYFMLENSLTAELIYLTPGEAAAMQPADAPEEVLRQTALSVLATSDVDTLDDEDIREGATATRKARDEAAEIAADPLEKSVDITPEGRARVEELSTLKYETPDLATLQPFWMFAKLPASTDALSLQEPFMIWLKAGLVAGVVISSPGIFYAVWMFVAAGLYPHERKYVYVLLPIAVLLFVGGVSLAFFVIFELVIKFLLEFNASLGISASPRLNDYMSFALFLPLGFGVAFQLPLVMLAVERLGLIGVETFISQWRVAILIITVVAMILTPAEVMSMIGMGVPLVFLYYFGILLCKFFPRRGFAPQVGYDPN